MADQYGEAGKGWLERYEKERDAEPGRRGLYTTIKDDHQHLWPSEEPCDCTLGGQGWERIAMRVTFSQRRAAAIRGTSAQREAGG
jgi:hypothetical protein